MATASRVIASQHAHITISKVRQSFGSLVLLPFLISDINARATGNMVVGLATPTNNKIIF